MIDSQTEPRDRLEQLQANLESRLRTPGAWDDQRLRNDVHRRLANVTSALLRFDLGLYGLCDQCGSPIDPDRLRIMPETSTCHRQHGPSTKRRLGAAAIPADAAADADERTVGIFVSRDAETWVLVPRATGPGPARKLVSSPALSALARAFLAVRPAGGAMVVSSAGAFTADTRERVATVGPDAPAPGPPVDQPTDVAILNGRFPPFTCHRCRNEEFSSPVVGNFGSWDELARSPGVRQDGRRLLAPLLPCGRHDLAWDLEDEFAAEEAWENWRWCRNSVEQRLTAADAEARYAAWLEPDRLPSPQVAPVEKPGPTSLRAWQIEALDAWERAGRRGVVQAVTGSGKTRFALAAAEKVLREGGRVAVIVPTIDLQQQWLREVRKHIKLLLPAQTGTLGGGGDHDLATCRLVVAVAPSAAGRELLPGPSPQPALLIADECHRYGSVRWAGALQTTFEYRLGLTATYERTDDGVRQFLQPYFGEPCFDVDYRRALDDGAICNFKVAFLGVRFTPSEAVEYRDADDRVRTAHDALLRCPDVPAQPFGDFMLAVGRIAQDHGHHWQPWARSYLKAFSDRRRTLAGATGKGGAMRHLLAPVSRASRTIIFAQTKAAASAAAAVYERAGLASDLIHAGLRRAQRKRVLAAFEGDEIDVLAAPRLLDEGIDVPDADLAIIAAHSRSRRQMIQRLGRVLRPKRDGRLARLVVLFIEGTSEDPERGSHEDFLDLVTPVADAVQVFRVGWDPLEVTNYLNDWRPLPS